MKQLRPALIVEQARDKVIILESCSAGILRSNRIQRTKILVFIPKCRDLTVPRNVKIFP
jgi:hypothetical protein